MVQKMQTFDEKVSKEVNLETTGHPRYELRSANAITVNPKISAFFE